MNKFTFVGKIADIKKKVEKYCRMVERGEIRDSWTVMQKIEEHKAEIVLLRDQTLGSIN